MQLEGRHPATVHLARFFAFDHLPEPLRTVSADCHHLAAVMIHQLPDGPELTTGLRRLLDAKDCFVRAALDLPPSQPEQYGDLNDPAKRRPPEEG